MYNVCLVLTQHGKELDRLEFVTGIRTLELAPTAGKKIRQKWGSYQFIVNGQRFFLKGVNWMPVDFLYREDEKEYRWILNAARQAGIQLIRVWSGGGYPESDCFYRLCNEMGLLVWQDSFVANMDTPGYPHAHLQEQLCLYLYRLRNHPALAVHCGGNEFNPYSPGNAASLFVIQRNLQDLDPARPFKRTTPDEGSTHIYRDMEPNWYAHCYGQLPFLGESGIHSFPNAKSLRQLLDEDEYTLPVNDMVEESFKESHPQLLNHFSEYVPDRVPRMLARSSAIMDVSCTDIEGLALASGMASAEYYQIMIQSMRSNYPVCGGMMLWVLKRSWTTVGIQLVDGMGDPIAPFYYVKNAYAPVNAVVALPHLIYAPGEAIPLPLHIINESGGRLQDVTVCLEVLDDQLLLLKRWGYQLDIPKDGYRIPIAQESFVTESGYGERFLLIRASLYQNGYMLQQSVYWPKCLKRMQQPAFREYYRAEPRENLVFDKGPWLKPTIESAPKASLACSTEPLPAQDGILRFALCIKNTAAQAAFPVCISVEEDGFIQNPSDNFFFLPAGETRQLTVDCMDRLGVARQLTLVVQAWNSDPTKMQLEVCADGIR